jgi:hypothetical protein
MTMTDQTTVSLWTVGETSRPPYTYYAVDLDGAVYRFDGEPRWDQKDGVWRPSVNCRDNQRMEAKCEDLGLRPGHAYKVTQAIQGIE